MKTLAKILLLVTILISSFSCSSNQDDPTPTIVVPIPTTIVPKITMSTKFNTLTNKLSLSLLLGKSVDKPTTVIISNGSALKATNNAMVFTINAGCSDTLIKTIDITTITSMNYSITSINGMTPTTEVSIVCDDPKMFKYVGATIIDISIINYSNNIIATTNGKFDLVVHIDPNKISICKDKIISRIVGNGFPNLDGIYNDYSIYFVGIDNYIKYSHKDNK